jgi:hypothetical protein
MEGRASSTSVVLRLDESARRTARAGSRGVSAHDATPITAAIPKNDPMTRRDTSKSYHDPPGAPPVHHHAGPCPRPEFPPNVLCRARRARATKAIAHLDLPILDVRTEQMLPRAPDGQTKERQKARSARQPPSRDRLQRAPPGTMERVTRQRSSILPAPPSKRTAVRLWPPRRRSIAPVPHSAGLPYGHGCMSALHESPGALADPAP